MNYNELSREELIREIEKLSAVKLQSEKTAVETKELFRAIFEQSPIAIELYDEEGRLTEVNEACLELFGITDASEIKRFSLFGDPNVTEAQLAKLKSGSPVRYAGPFDFGKVRDLNLYQTSREGIIWLDVSITPLMAIHLLKGYLVQIRDISEQKKLEDALRRSEEEYRNFYLNAPIGLYRTTPDGRIIMANQALVEMLGYETREQLQDLVLSADHFGQNYDRQAFVEEITRVGEIKDREAQWVCRDGSVRIVEENAKVIYDPYGQIMYFDGSVEDITDRKQTEDALNLALVRAESSDRLKTAFLNNISHEVRTPLNGILGFVSMIDDPEVSSEDRLLYKEILHISSDRLLNTINDYMDISLIVSENISVRQSEFNLMDLLNKGCQEFMKQATSKGVVIKVIPPDDHGQTKLFSDPELLRKVYYHLLSNAVKFTEYGTIHISFKTMGERVEVTVKDSGIGISEELTEKIFDTFLQADLSNTRRHEGSGLGLAIAKGLIHLLGGEIWVKSTIGFGSTFGFSIPGLVSTEEPPAPVPEVRTESGKPGPVVLIAEDDAINIYLLETMLSRTQATVWHVENGLLAVNFCKNHPEVDIVLMDLKMPEMDGFEATQQIKAFRKELPVIAVTAFAMAGDEELALGAGCDDYISKPFTAATLIHKMKKYVTI